ncbi:hypothetical protein Cni_G01243 [Canna indica]|uniref:Protein kinase domain-containing protein n=1 Tax=Canna indica TaxID=4628 RepID=A0AAQ3JNZ7_9LILI|nr:hypothetical protein Cni_G01243 [Canna indica]
MNREDKGRPPMEWTRGQIVGRGSFATVSLAYGRSRQLPSLMAVKSAPLSASGFLRHEESVLYDLSDCPHLVRCFGHDVTADPSTGAQSYDLFLEYAPAGTLRDALRRAGGSLPEPAIRRFMRSVLLGLRHVHARGYAHCDVKLENLLVVGAAADVVKIADFGLAKKIDDGCDARGGGGIRGTPMYMSPEAVARGEYGAAADVWSLGCVVAEMATGRPAWAGLLDGGHAAWGLLFKIGFNDELPEIPTGFSEEGKDFLRRCFVKKPEKRWTTEMLLQHPFIAMEEDVVGVPSAYSSIGVPQCRLTESSPRSVLGLSQWPSPRSQCSSICFTSLTESTSPDSSASSPADRIGELATTRGPNWISSSSSSSWFDVRVTADISLDSPESKHEHVQMSPADRIGELATTRGPNWFSSSSSSSWFDVRVLTADISLNSPESRHEQVLMLETSESNEEYTDTIQLQLPFFDI